MFDATDFDQYEELSVAMTQEIDSTLAAHLDQGPDQEDLTFAYWLPSAGASRFTGVLNQVMLPRHGERVLDGNVSFMGTYLDRVLASRPPGAGVALLHSHLGPGWQDMSDDDIFAEQVRLAGAVAGQSDLPVLGLTRGTDGAWSARYWLRTNPRRYAPRDCSSVRVVGQRLRTTFHPTLAAPPALVPAQEATVSVWGQIAQADLARTHVGIVGLGSVGSILAESLARMGVQRVILVDHDIIEERNLDRTLGVTRADLGASKVDVARRQFMASSTSSHPRVTAVEATVLSLEGIAAILDCDVLVSCVDRPWPRFLLNATSYSHLIPLIDGGIAVHVNEESQLQHLTWSAHTVGPGRSCLFCLGAVRRSDVSLDQAGLLDDPDYVKGLSAAERERYGRRNVFAFSLGVASLESLQLAGLVSGLQRVSGIGPQRYNAYPGSMDVIPAAPCSVDCELSALTATAADMTANVDDPKAP
jgi:molybdopterin-synthase adenylyltransferase